MIRSRITSGSACLRSWLVACIVLLVARWSVAQTAPSSLLLEFPFIMTHDAATGYLGEGLIERWAKTQSSTMNTSVRFTGSEGAKDATPPAFTAQLNSGTRAFDARPYLDGANLVFHHGVVVVHTALTDAFAEVFKWASLPENHGELVVLYMNKCEGGAGCWDRTFEVLNKNNITWAHPDGQCFQKNMTYEAALRLGRNPTIGGGSVLAVDERCMLENFEEDVECYGKAGSVDYWCYDDKTGHYPFDRFDAYMRKYTGAVRAEGGARTGAGDAESVRIDMLRKYAQTRAPRTESELEHFSRLEEMPRGRYVECWSGALCRGAGAGLGSETAGQGPIRVIKGDGGQMWMAQAHWQYSAASVIAGALHDSSILLDSKRSGMNARVARSIRAGEYKRLNILELDYVSNSGLEVFKALRAPG